MREVADLEAKLGLGEGGGVSGVFGLGGGGFWDGSVGERARLGAVAGAGGCWCCEYGPGLGSRCGLWAEGHWERGGWMWGASVDMFPSFAIQEGRMVLPGS